MRRRFGTFFALLGALVITDLVCARAAAVQAQDKPNPATAPAAVQAQEQAKPAAPPAPAKNDYSNGDNWLCRPGRQDACAVDLSTTVVAADGKLTVEKWSSNPKAAIDCFYVYPTVSNDQTPNSDMNAGPEELAVIRSQFARFGSECRVFAPLYRQVTLTALRAGIAGKPMTVDRALGYN